MMLMLLMLLLMLLLSLMLLLLLLLLLMWMLDIIITRLCAINFYRYWQRNKLMASFLLMCYQLDSKRKHQRPYCPVLPVAPVTPVAGQVVTYRHMGEQYTDTVLAVGEFFDKPAYRIGRIWISGGQLVGVVNHLVSKVSGNTSVPQLPSPTQKEVTSSTGLETDHTNWSASMMISLTNWIPKNLQAISMSTLTRRLSGIVIFMNSAAEFLDCSTFTSRTISQFYVERVLTTASRSRRERFTIGIAGGLKPYVIQN
jgi:hypothetical protein